MTYTSGLDIDSQSVLGESSEDFAKLQQEFYSCNIPTSPEARFYLDTALRNEWILRRYHRVDAQLWEYHGTLAQRGTGVELGEGFTKSSTTFSRFSRLITAAHKAFKSAMEDFKRVQAEHNPAPIPEPPAPTPEPPAPPAETPEKTSPQPQQTKPETQQSASFRTTLSGPLPRNDADAAFNDLDRLLYQELRELGIIDDEI